MVAEDKKKTARVELRIYQDEREKLRSLATRYGISMTSLVCMLVNKEWEKRNPGSDQGQKSL